MFKYSDNEYFNDSKYFGLVKEDGKPENETCLDLRLFQFKSNTYSDPVQVTDLPIKPSSNFQKKWRYYSFTIPGTQLATRLVETKNSNQILYTGYYAIAYYASGTDQIQMSYFFEFTVIIDKVKGTPLSAHFMRGFQNQDLFPYQQDLGIIVCFSAETSLQWCSDLDCEFPLITAPDLHINDSIFLKHIMKRVYLSNFYLIGTQVWYIGDGLIKQATIISMNNTIKGQVIIQTKADVVWRSVSILVQSTLSTTQTGERRLLVQTEFGTLYGQSIQIECIKAEGEETCASCEVECQINGFAKEGCDACSYSQEIEIFFLIAFLAFMI